LRILYHHRTEPYGVLPEDQRWDISIDLAGANLVKANLSGIDLDSESVIHTYSLYRGHFRIMDLSVNLAGADLTGAKLDGAKLSGADLTDTKLDGANLANADLGRAFIGASFRGADLRGANLSSADLRGADLAGAVWDVTTEWPSDEFLMAVRTGSAEQARRFVVTAAAAQCLSSQAPAPPWEDKDIAPKVSPAG
jgi:hypothetical protein